MLDFALQLEALDDFMDVGAETVEVFLEIGQQDLPVVGGSVVEAGEGPLGDVVEHIAGGRLERRRVQLHGVHFLFLEAHLFQHRLLGGHEQGIQTTQHHHGQDDITVLAAHIDIAQAVVGDVPDKGDEFIVYAVIHWVVVSVVNSVCSVAW